MKYPAELYSESLRLVRPIPVIGLDEAVELVPLLQQVLGVRFAAGCPA